jgi:hypothetical protein
MPYFPKYNTIFIHIPKNGGTTVTNLFSPNCAYSHNGWTDSTSKIDFEFIHSNFFYYKNKFKDDIENMKIFTLVRNPYDRILSYFFFHLKRINSKKIIFQNYEDTLLNMFKFYLKELLLKNKITTKNNNKFIVNKTQTSYLLDEDNEINKNIHIFKFEKFFNDNRLPAYNKSEYETSIKKYEIYSKETIDIVKNYFIEDFKNFDYNTEL